MRVLIVLLSILLAACGGGGNLGTTSSPPPLPPPPPPPPPPAGCVKDMAINFNAVSGAELGTVYVSNDVIADQLCGPRTIGIASSNGSAHYSVDGGPWIDGSAEIDRGQSVRIRMRSSPTFGTRNWASLTIGQINCRVIILLGELCVLEGAISEFEVTTTLGSAANAPIVTLSTPADGEIVNTSILTVSGTASDPDGVEEIRVNGDLARTDDGFSNWVADVPLITGTNEIIVSSADSLLNRQPEAAVLSVENTRSVFRAAESIDMVPGSRVLYVIDREFGGLVAVNTQTDESSIVSRDEGSTFPFVEPRRLLVDEVAHRAWAIDRGYEEPLEIDLMTGDRRLLSGTGESLEDARDLALDEARNKLMVLAQDLGQATSSTLSSGRIVTVDLVTGSRQRLSDNSMPPGEPDFWITYAVHFDSAGDRLILMQRNKIVAIDPTTGSRQELFGLTALEPDSSDLDVTGGRLIIARPGLTGFIAVDLATGVSSDLIRTDGPEQLEYDDYENRIFFTNGGHVGVIYLMTGEVIVEYY